MGAPAAMARENGAAADAPPPSGSEALAPAPPLSRKRWALRLAAIAVILAIPTIIVAGFWAQSLAWGLAALMLALAVCVLALVPVVRAAAAAAGLRALAKSEGWTRLDQDPADRPFHYGSAGPFGLGWRRQASRIVRGSWQGLPFDAFTLSFREGTLEASEARSLLVAVVPAPSPGPALAAVAAEAPAWLKTHASSWENAAEGPPGPTAQPGEADGLAAARQWWSAQGGAWSLWWDGPLLVAFRDASAGHAAGALAGPAQLSKDDLLAALGLLRDMAHRLPPSPPDAARRRASPRNDPWRDATRDIDARWGALNRRGGRLLGWGLPSVILAVATVALASNGILPNPPGLAFVAGVPACLGLVATGVGIASLNAYGRRRLLGIVAALGAPPNAKLAALQLQAMRQHADKARRALRAVLAAAGTFLALVALSVLGSAAPSGQAFLRAAALALVALLLGLLLASWWFAHSFAKATRRDVRQGMAAAGIPEPRVRWQVSARWR